MSLPSTALTAEALGRVLGRSATWVREHYLAEQLAKRLPAPLNGGRPPLVWDAAQVYACLDRPLPAAARAYAAAFRAAHAAASQAPPEIEAELAAQERLDARFGGASTSEGSPRVAAGFPEGRRHAPETGATR